MKRLYIAIFLLVFANATYAADMDSDGDGLSDMLEKIHYTDMAKSDTDGDGYPDGLEVANGYSPLYGNKARLVDVDSDKDYLHDGWEIKIGTDIFNPDSDGDLYLDGTEVAASYDPHNPEPIRVEKRIFVDISDLSLRYSFDNAVLEDIPVSTGKPDTPTPIGEFEVLGKYPIKHYYGYPNTPHNLHFTTVNGLGYYIHSAYWHDAFGIEGVSGGCVNVRESDMERLYRFAQHGTPVIVTE